MKAEMSDGIPESNDSNDRAAHPHRVCTPPTAERDKAVSNKNSSFYSDPAAVLTFVSCLKHM